ncbi:MAG: phosphatase PAP2 family protein [Candidatus Rokubacteria bacterium]|nr:phosphatase PAP2 family protein [Candidatus Rokubacteria bacterium]
MTSPASPRLLSASQHRILVLVAVLASLLFLLLADLREEHDLLVLDRHVQGALQTLRTPALDEAMKTVTKLGSGWVLVPAIGVLTAVFWRHVRPRVADLVATGIALAILSHGAKWFVDRPRPNLRPQGYPSGHTFFIVVFCGILLYLLWTCAASARARRAALALSVLAVFVVGLSRIYLRAHWLTDVLGSLVGGIGLVIVAALWMDWRHRREHAAEASISPGNGDPVPRT